MICSICEKEIKDLYPYNAEPVTDGKCCSSCNTTHVIPARMYSVYSYKPEKPKNKEDDK
jgi:hypothetical protein|tara:strand:+ start:4365 stop:4541 length:177 start_codon:yes stop_codon:yes gene_type:complete